MNNTSLIVLDLSSCKIADDGAVAIASAIGSNSEIELRVLRFRDNFVSNSAGQVIVDEFQNNTSITTADFRGNRIEHAKLSRIRQFCKRNMNHIRNQVTILHFYLRSLFFWSFNCLLISHTLKVEILKRV